MGTEYIYLVGADEVSRAGSRMAAAAADMQRAADTISEAIYQQRQYMEEWITNFERIMKHE